MNCHSPPSSGNRLVEDSGKLVTKLDQARHKNESLKSSFSVGYRKRKVSDSDDEDTIQITDIYNRNRQKKEAAEVKQLPATSISFPKSNNYQSESEKSFNQSSLSFPQRLRKVLDDESNHSVLRWHSHGLSFKVFDKETFIRVTLPRYFGKQSKYWSFTRKLGRWGFIRVTSGAEAGSYYHPLFKRDEPRLTNQISSQCNSPYTRRTVAESASNIANNELEFNDDSIRNPCNDNKQTPDNINDIGNTFITEKDMTSLPIREEYKASRNILSLDPHSYMHQTPRSSMNLIDVSHQSSSSIWAALQHRFDFQQKQQNALELLLSNRASLESALSISYREEEMQKMIISGEKRLREEKRQKSEEIIRQQLLENPNSAAIMLQLQQQLHEKQKQMNQSASYCFCDGEAISFNKLQELTANQITDDGISANNNNHFRHHSLQGVVFGSIPAYASLPRDATRATSTLAPDLSFSATRSLPSLNNASNLVLGPLVEPPHGTSLNNTEVAMQMLLLQHFSRKES